MRSVAILVLLACGAAGQACRDRFVQPFSAGSIWNTAVGSGAVFMPAGLYTGMPRDIGCALRANSPSRRRQCPGVPANATPQVQRNFFYFLFLFYFYFVL